MIHPPRLRISCMINTLPIRNRIVPHPCSPIFLYTSRNIRIRSRARAGFFRDPLKRDETLLKRLEAQLESVKDKIKREEEQKELSRRQAHHGFKGKPENQSLENHNLYFWEKVLSQSDREELALNGIHSLDQLYTIYEIAESTLNRPPHPPFDRLDRRLQVAYKMYNSIPEKLAQASRAAANSSSEPWF